MLLFGGKQAESEVAAVAQRHGAGNGLREPRRSSAPWASVAVSFPRERKRWNWSGQRGAPCPLTCRRRSTSAPMRRQTLRNGRSLQRQRREAHQLADPDRIFDAWLRAPGEQVARDGVARASSLWGWTSCCRERISSPVGGSRTYGDDQGSLALLAMCQSPPLAFNNLASSRGLGRYFGFFLLPVTASG